MNEKINRIAYMDYKAIAMISFIAMFFIVSCEKKSETVDIKNPNTISKNEIMKEDNVTVNDTIPKRYYRKDAAKVDTFPYFADYKGYRYYFPCGPCRDKFIQDREEYLEKWVKKGRKIRKRKL